MVKLKGELLWVQHYGRICLKGNILMVNVSELGKLKTPNVYKQCISTCISQLRYVLDFN